MSDEGAPEGGEGEVAGVVELHRRGQEGLEADGAGGGFLEGEALLLLVLRGVEGADDVDEAGGQRLDGGHAVVLGAERGAQLEEGAVVADVEFVQRQVVDRGAGGDGQARRAGAGEGGEGARRW